MGADPGFPVRRPQSFRVDPIYSCGQKVTKNCMKYTIFGNMVRGVSAAGAPFKSAINCEDTIFKIM